MRSNTKLIKKIALFSLINASAYYLFKSGKLIKGNSDEYSIENTESLYPNELTNKKIIFLGSSVTYGSASNGVSFVDYLKRRNGIIPIKEALSGTTLVDKKVRGRDSYITRMKNIDKDIKVDCFVCQLSTNDASLNLELGKISNSYDINDFDTQTILGAIEYIVAYAKNIWNCPIIFYTGTKYNSKKYEEMVNSLLDIKEKWNIEVLDLFNDEEMNNVSKEDYKLFMVNGIHPSKAGYKIWWTPKFEEILERVLKGERK